MSLMVNVHSLRVSGWENVGIPTPVSDCFAGICDVFCVGLDCVTAVAGGGVAVHFALSGVKSFSIFDVFGQNLR